MLSRIYLSVRLRDFCFALNWTLGSNSLTNIVAGSFNGLNRLTSLNLHQNGLTHVNSTMWTRLEYLETLDITNNYIATISPEAFSNLIWLKNLHLGENSLYELHASMWVGLQFLEFLSMPKNGIKDVPQHVIAHMPALKKLGFASNQLKTISADVFNPEDYPDSNGRPEILKLGLYGNPLHVLCADWSRVMNPVQLICITGWTQVAQTSVGHIRRTWIWTAQVKRMHSSRMCTTARWPYFPACPVREGWGSIKQLNLAQESLSGCLIPGGVPGLGVSAPGRGLLWGVYLVPGVCTWSQGCVPGPRGVYLVPGGVCS